MPPTQFQKPMCQPSSFGAGRYHFSWVSSMKRKLEMMKPLPPTTCNQCQLNRQNTSSVELLLGTHLRRPVYPVLKRGRHAAQN